MLLLTLALSLIAAEPEGKIIHTIRNREQTLTLHELRIETTPERARQIRQAFLQIPFGARNSAALLEFPAGRLALAGVSLARPTGVVIVFLAEYAQEDRSKIRDLGRPLVGLPIVKEQ